MALSGAASECWLDRERTIIGRAPSCDLIIDDPGVSRQHCVIERRGAEDFFLLDLGSANGTSLSEQRIGLDGVRLNDRDIFRLGTIQEPRLRFITTPPRGEVSVVALSELFARLDLPAPPIPESLRGTLSRQGPGCFGTQPVLCSSLYGEAFIRAQSLTSAQPDFLLIGQGGHGVNSHTIQYFLKLWPLTLFVEIPYGGVYMDQAHAQRTVRTCFAMIDKLIAIFPKLSLLLGENGQLLIVANDNYSNSGWATGPESERLFEKARRATLTAEQALRHAVRWTGQSDQIL
jgi:hypothetical protein